MTKSSSSPSLQYIKGIGPKRADVLRSEGIGTIEDLLFYFPRGYLDRSAIVPIGQLRSLVTSGEEVTVIGEVTKVEARRAWKSNRSMYILNVEDESGLLRCVWFEGSRWLRGLFDERDLVALSAAPTLDKRGRLQFVHPAFDRLKNDEENEPNWANMLNTGAIIPKYSSTRSLTEVGLDSRGLRRIIRRALDDHLDLITESLSDEIRDRHRLLPLRNAIHGIHKPASNEDLASSQRRLKYDELFFFQLLLAFRKRGWSEDIRGIQFDPPGNKTRVLRTSLPFELTRAQDRVLGEICTDLQTSRPMNRLLQGDVGSGKTVVALLAALVAVENGCQAAFMAPTEVLADQHFRTLSHLLRGIDVNVRLLVGGQKKKLRLDVRDDIRRGSAQIVVGTHALLEEGVEFAKLGLVVIDEQHRFGVDQRAKLRQKGMNPHVLVMTATPIPRTLAMTLYGDLDMSTIDEMPANRLPVRTAVRTNEDKAKAYDFIAHEARRGRQAFIVFPLIESSEKLDLQAATAEFEVLRDGLYRNLAVGLLHGRLKSEEKGRVMEQFVKGAINVLVTTTVIEVGIDVPNATVMLVENAERFGLSQLHQLRGRVGRGQDKSYCILVSNAAVFEGSLKKLSADERRQEQQKARVRLETMEKTNDGFEIAEVDLRLRGPGEFFGTRQSGVPGLRIANIVEDIDILKQARADAFSLLHKDPQLLSHVNAPVRTRFEQKYKATLDISHVS